MQNNNNTIDNQFLILGRLGGAATSPIYRVRRVNDNNEYAAKVGDPNHFPQELQMTTLVSGLNNPNIIHLEGHDIGTVNYQGTITNNANYMILEYCPKGDLLKYLEIEKFTERQAGYIFKKILLGVQALHVANICHRDLKLTNILLDQNFNPKISDFFFATQFRQDNQPIMLTDRVGTRHCMSPNIFSNKSYNGEKADIFSLGVILFELVSRAFPFEVARKEDHFYGLIMKRNFPQFWHECKIMDLSENFKNLFISMVDPNENNRPNIAQVLAHPWFNEINLNNLDNQQLAQLENDVRTEFIRRENILLTIANHIH